MNALEQRIRHTAIAQAEAQIDHLVTGLEALGTLVQAIDERQVALAQGAADAYDELARTVGQLQARIVDLEHEDVVHERVIVRLRPLAETTFLQRLSWLLTGRT